MIYFYYVRKRRRREEEEDKILHAWKECILLTQMINIHFKNHMLHTRNFLSYFVRISCEIDIIILSLIYLYILLRKNLHLNTNITMGGNIHILFPYAILPGLIELTGLYCKRIARACGHGAG